MFAFFNIRVLGVSVFYSYSLQMIFLIWVYCIEYTIHFQVKLVVLLQVVFLLLHTNVEVLGWKPQRLEVLASRNGVLHPTFAPQDSDLQMTHTPGNLSKFTD
ncbi:hypothetical protein F5Y17DRAFT_18924 [Xylariaceae sp. FL0594]|nr:hypothetical protein F5Y17DRAFT_18924 [Xylariaceae sp. FL0594]